MRFVRVPALALLMVCGATFLQAQSSTVDVEDAFGYESITVSTTSIGFTSATIGPSSGQSARHAYCTLETAAIRYRYDGTDPTSSEGHPLAANASLHVWGMNNVRRFRAIRSGGSDGTLKCTYER